MANFLCREYTAIVGLMCLTVLVLRNDKMIRNTQLLFLSLILAEFVDILACELEDFFRNWDEESVWYILFSTISYTIQPFLVYFAILINSRERKSLRFRLYLLIPTFINFIIVSGALLCGDAFDADVRFIRSYLGFGPMVTSAIYMLLMLFIQNSPGKRNGFSAELAAMVGCISISIYLDFVFDNTRVSFLRNAIMICIAVLYANYQMRYLQEDFVNEKQKWKQEIEDEQLSMMLRQIRPHYIFNSLNSISYLFHSDPNQAERMLIQFSDYLRKNLEFLRKRGAIPFSDELEYIAAYLSLEQLRLGDRLQISYDIMCSRFLVPSLTLQPIVQNAVRHSIEGRNGGGMVTISAYETSDSYEIRVSDNGAGFDPSYIAEDEMKTSLNIEDVRNRLLTLVNGTLHIESRIGMGTIATITIPKGGNV